VDKDVSEKPDIFIFKVDVNNIVSWRLEAGIVEQEEVVIAERPIGVGDYQPWIVLLVAAT
jgi:hypothetical protein